MNASLVIEQIARGLRLTRLEAVLIGNAAAALHGAPVTTLDFDFMFRKTPGNLKKLKLLADSFGGTVFRPYYPVSDLYRVVVDEKGLQLDFMSLIHGVRSFASLRSRASEVAFGKEVLIVADLRDIIKSKKAAGRARDRAVLEILEKTLGEKEKKEKSSEKAK